jgi:carotenoid 1,2-hydratase
MLRLSSPDEPLPRALLAAPGGFAWWYADALDAQGSGLVCIWSFGLPFLPGYLSGHRSGHGVPAGQRPSVNLALYERGRLISYSLLELPPERAVWEEGRWTFGDCTFEHVSAGSTLRLRAHLDLPVAGSPDRLRGTFEIAGPRARVEAPHEASTAHVWSPVLGPANATATFDLGDQRLLTLDGSGYHDRNGSDTALDDLGILHWTWGRQILGDRLVIYYLTWPKDEGAEPLWLAYEIDREGAVREVVLTEVQLRAPRRGRFGMPWWGSFRALGLDQPLEIEVSPPVDDGPFYLRALTRARLGDQTGVGWTELCRPDRIDRACIRPLVRMAVQHETSANSLWLPLFTGPSHDRARRLLRWWQAPALAAR